MDASGILLRWVLRGEKRGIKATGVKERCRSKGFIAILGCTAEKYNQGRPEGRWEEITSGKSSCQGLGSQKMAFPPLLWGEDSKRNEKREGGIQRGD